MSYPFNNTNNYYKDIKKSFDFNEGISMALRSGGKSQPSQMSGSTQDPIKLPSPLSSTELLPTSDSAGMCCYDFRTPEYNTVLYGDNRKGVLPAGAWEFKENGTVINSCNGLPMDNNSLFARTSGPIYGVTMGACTTVPIQSIVLNQAGSFSPLPSTMARKCFV